MKKVYPVSPLTKSEDIETTDSFGSTTPNQPAQPKYILFKVEVLNAILDKVQDFPARQANPLTIFIQQNAIAVDASQIKES